VGSLKENYITTN